MHGQQLLGEGQVVTEGQTLDGTYQLMRLVGEGGMGAVYEATHARLAGRYAIKVLLPELSDSLEARACFDREARITSLLQHPNVVQIIDHNTTADGTSYLVMEYLSGESLGDRLAREGHLDARSVVDIVDQIAAGLAAAHARGIVHRDLKPDNVFLIPVEGRATALIKILDFGISELNRGREASEPIICGTPQYMAPEQAEGRAGEVDPTTDQYALAVIALELLTGHNPFAAGNIGTVLERVRGGIVPVTGSSGALDAVLARALSRSSSERFSSVTAFAEAFRAAAPEQSSGPPRTARGRRARRGGGNVRLGFAAATAIACTSFLGTGAANRAAGPPPAAVVSTEAAATTGPATEDAQAVPEARLEAGAEAVRETGPAPAAPELRVRVRRARRAGAVRDDGPMLTIETAARRDAATALAPDEDATMAPSDF